MRKQRDGLMGGGGGGVGVSIYTTIGFGPYDSR